MSVEMVFKGRDNLNAVVFGEDNGEIDFSDVTRMELFLKGDTTSIDTDENPDLIDWTTVGNGVVIFNLSDLDVVVNKDLPATLVAYDPSRPDGQVIVYQDDRKLTFRFIDTLAG